MTIEGFSHITFIVRDLDRTTNFLKVIFDAQEVYCSADQTYSIAREKFFLIHNLWIAIMQGESLSKKTYNHIAFKISEQDFEQYVHRLNSIDIEICQSRNRIAGEGRSLYFYDYDNHLFELHTGTLEQRLAAYQPD